MRETEILYFKLNSLIVYPFFKPQIDTICNFLKEAGLCISYEYGLGWHSASVAYSSFNSYQMSVFKQST